jgi:hypothetical protein
MPKDGKGCTHGDEYYEEAIYGRGHGMYKFRHI